jgi:LGFP repeat-containing protein
MGALTMTFTRFAFLLAGFAAAVFGQQTTTINVPANQSWTNTGIYLNPGETVQIDARGVIEAVSPSDTRANFHRVPPSGRPRQDNTPQPDMPALVLLARIGDGPVLEAGAHAEFRAGGRNGTGELQLGINDGYVADNTGSWTVQVRVHEANSSISQSQNNRRFPNDPNSNDRYRNDRYRNDRSQADQSYRSYDADGAAGINSKAQQLGRNVLGAPLSDVRTAADGVGRYREYSNGVIYWSPDTGAYAVLGPIKDEWVNRGAESGELGYPISDETQTRNGMNRTMRFQRGTITWNERTGARVDRR